MYGVAKSAVVRSEHAIEMVVHYCRFCCFRSKSWKEWLTHTFQAHSSAPNFVFKCGINGCVQTFRSLSAVMSHIRRRHPGFNPDTLCEDRSVDSMDVDMSAANGQNGPGSDDIDINNGLDSSCLPHSESDIPDHLKMQKACATLLLTLKEKHKLSQTALDFSVEQVREVIQCVTDDVRKRVESEMLEYSTATGMKTPDLSSCFQDIDPFVGLHSEYMQQKFYKEHFHLIEPETVYLGTNENGQKDTFQYVPLLEGLKALINNPEIQNEIMQSHSRSDEFIADFCDAALIKEHPLFKNDKHALQIVAYYDEIETANSLGSHAGHNSKLGMFYYTLGNLRPELRSSHKAIQLITCVSCPVLNKYGFESILKPFIKDVNMLAKDDLVLKFDGVEMRFYGTLLVMLADTLAAHDLGGFKSGVGRALRKCRQCMATGTDIQSKFNEEEFQLRTPAAYDYHCSLLSGDMAESDSTTYGIRYRSPLNDIEHFHVANMMQMPQDVMHVLFEGVLAMEVHMMICAFFKKKCLTLSILNERLNAFDFGTAEARNQPPKSFNEKDFDSSSTAQLWTFATLLPLIIGDKVPQNDPLWECFLLLLEITKHCTARVTSSASVAYVKAMVDQHHREFTQCYPDKWHTPKMHYMVHLPTQLLLTGPLVTTWCMRMEAKHSYFKSIAHLGNYRNIPYSVARRHQRLLCANLRGNFFTYSDLQCGPCYSSGICSLSVDPLAAEILSTLPDTDLETYVSRPNWIQIYGNQFNRSQYVSCGWQDDDLPMFALIKDILVVAECPLLVLEKFTTEGVNNHLLSHLITPTRHVFVTKVSSLPHKDLITAHFYPGDGGLYITMKCHVQKTT